MFNFNKMPKSRIIERQIPPETGNSGYIFGYDLGGAGEDKQYHPDSVIVIGTLGGNAPRILKAYCRFLNITIPQGATINDAYLIFLASTTHVEDTVNIQIYCEDADNPSTFSSYADVDGRTLTTAYTAWNSVSHFSEHVEYQFPSITSAVQEVVNRAGWSPGNSLVIIMPEVSSTPVPAAFRTLAGRDHSPLVPGRLIINYS